MRRLFKAVAALALVQNGIKAEPVSNSSSMVSFEMKPVSANSSYPWEGCSTPNSIDYCVFDWGPAHGYPPVLDSKVEAECFEDKGCCPDSSSKTLYNDCIWDGCDGQKDALHNSTAFCEQQESLKNVTKEDCFTGQGCCPNSSSITDYSPCSSSEDSNDASEVGTYLSLAVGAASFLGAAFSFYKIEQGAVPSSKLSWSFRLSSGLAAVSFATAGFIASGGLSTVCAIASGVSVVGGLFGEKAIRNKQAAGAGVVPLLPVPGGGGGAAPAGHCNNLTICSIQ